MRQGQAKRGQTTLALLIGMIMTVSGYSPLAQGASVDVFINAFNLGVGNTIVDDTSAGPSIFREVNTGVSGPRFSSGEVLVDLRTAEINIRTAGSLVSSSDAAGAIGALNDTVTFDIDQAENEFIDLQVRFDLNGMLLYNPTGANSTANLRVALFSFNNGTATDSLVSERFYNNNFFIGDQEPVSVADPDNFVLVSQFGDIVFDNEDRGLVQGAIRLVGDSPTLTVEISLTVNGLTEFFTASNLEFVNLPAAVSFTSESGFFLESAADADGDGVDDTADNCTLVANVSQLDTDADGYGNACDADFNNDCTVNFLDLAEFSDAFLSMDLLYDLNSDGVVNFADFVPFSNAFFLAPGPGLGGC